MNIENSGERTVLIETVNTRYRAFTLPEFLEALGGCHVRPAFKSQEEYDLWWESVQNAGATSANAGS